MKNIRVCYLKIFNFFEVKVSIYLNRHVFVMYCRFYCRAIFYMVKNILCVITSKRLGSASFYPISILRKSIAGRYWPVRVADGPITARCSFIKNASWVLSIELVLYEYTMVPC